MTRPRYYPLADGVPNAAGAQRDYMAVRTGEFREAERGEWYLSGAIPKAYRFPGVPYADGSVYPRTVGRYHIVRIVHIRRVEVIEEVPSGS